MTKIGLAVAAGLFAAPALAQSEAEMQRFLVAAAEVGCVITPTTGPQIEARSGLSADVLLKIMQQLVAMNAVTVPDSTTVRITAGPCAG